MENENKQNTQESMIQLFRIEHNDGDQFNLKAFICSDGALTLKGEDSCNFVKRFLSLPENKYEYFYSFDLDNTNKLKKLLKSNNLLDSLNKFFGGKDKTFDLTKLCVENKINFTTQF